MLEGVWEGMNVQIQVFFYSALLGREWSVSRLGSFTRNEITIRTHWNEGWVVPRTDLDDNEKEKGLTISGIELLTLYLCT
jgi:hypothetical protein